MKRGLQLVLMLCVFLLGTQVSFAAGLLGGTGVSDARVYDSEGLIKWEPHTRDFSRELGDQTSQRI